MNKKPYGYIYKITNIINNKIYVGLTTKTPEERWKQHVSTAHKLNHKDSKCLFKRAIRKYGQDNFKLEIIDIADSEEELKEKEIYWIKKLKSYAFDDDGYGYNSTRGGDMPSEINKKKIV